MPLVVLFEPGRRRSLACQPRTEGWLPPRMPYWCIRQRARGPSFARTEPRADVAAHLVLLQRRHATVATQTFHPLVDAGVGRRESLPAEARSEPCIDEDRRTLVHGVANLVAHDVFEVLAAR